MDLINGLSVGRIALGAAALVSPSLTAKVCRLDAAANPQLAYMTRLFGSREIVLGALTLAASGAGRRTLVGVGLAVDSADTLAALDAVRTGSVSRTTGGALLAPAVAAAVVGVVAIRNR